MTTAPFMTECDIQAYRTWRERRTAPAYLRGMPSWMWQSAMGCPPRRRSGLARVT